MTLNEFARECRTRGYGNEEEAKAWCERHPKDDYIEDDLIEFYRYANRKYPCSIWRTMYGGHYSTKHYINIGGDGR